MLNLTLEFRKSLDKKTSVKKAVFLDLNKVFKMVDQNQLLDVLHSLGFTGPIHEILSSYLLSGSQTIRMRGKFSKSKHIDFGVPQGSVLGPSHFIFYISEIPRVSSKLDLLFFAEASVLIQNQSTDQLTSRMVLLTLLCSRTTENCLSIATKHLKFFSAKTKTLIDHPDRSLFSRTLINKKLLNDKKSQISWHSS